MQEARWAILPKPRGKHCGETARVFWGRRPGWQPELVPTLPHAGRDLPRVGLRLLIGQVKASKFKES